MLISIGNTVTQKKEKKKKYVKTGQRHCADGLNKIKFTLFIHSCIILLSLSCHLPLPTTRNKRTNHSIFFEFTKILLHFYLKCFFFVAPAQYNTRIFNENKFEKLKMMYIQKINETKYKSKCFFNNCQFHDISHWKNILSNNSVATSLYKDKLLLKLLILTLIRLLELNTNIRTYIKRTYIHTTQ